MSRGHILITELDSYRVAGVTILIHENIKSYMRKQNFKFQRRILTTDFKIGQFLYRVVAIYIPHADFDFQELEDCYDYLEFIMKDALRRRMRCVLGGDFNTVFNHGDCGVLLNSLTGQFDLSFSKLFFW